MSPIREVIRLPLRATAITAALYSERKRPSRMLLPTRGQRSETTASIRLRCVRGASSLNVWSVAGIKPRIFCRSTTDSMMPTKINRSPACRRSCGPTAGRISPWRSISARYNPGRCRKPACSTLCPASGPPGWTSISTVYCRGSSVRLIAGRRSGNSQRLKSSRKTTLAAAQGKPTQVMSNIPIAGKSGSLALSISPATTRFVLVPIIVHTPPKVAAKAIGMNNLDGLMFVFLQISSTTGMNMATTGVLFRNALSVVTGKSNFNCAPSTVRGRPNNGCTTNAMAPVWVSPATTTNNAPTVSKPEFPMPANASPAVGKRSLPVATPMATRKRQTGDAQHVRRRPIASQADDEQRHHHHRDPAFPGHTATSFCETALSKPNGVTKANDRAAFRPDGAAFSGMPLRLPRRNTPSDACDQGRLFPTRSRLTMTSNTRPRRTRRTVNVMPCSRTTSPGFAGGASRCASHADMVSRGGSSVKSRRALSCHARIEMSPYGANRNVPKWHLFEGCRWGHYR